MAENKNLISDPERSVNQLIEILHILRDPDRGCSWDIEQNFKSIVPFTIEEAYEVADAIEQKNWSALKIELGDLLLQTVYHSQIASEQGLFNFEDIVKSICDKMVARHPHIFANENTKNSTEKQAKAGMDWESLKASERQADEKYRTLDDLALGLPALMRAAKLQKRAARVGFDWPDIDQVFKKVIEETRELKEAKDLFESDKITEEFGDLLFVLVNFGRHLNIDAEDALRKANAKFTRRFNYIECELAKHGSTPENSSLQEMEKLWNKSKSLEY